MEVIEKPLGKITAILADIGLEVTYAYDDLVFIQHSTFMLQFTDDPAQLKLYHHVECNPEQAAEIEQTIKDALAKEGISALPSGQYSITENDDETINIEFR